MLGLSNQSDFSSLDRSILDSVFGMSSAHQYQAIRSLSPIIFQIILLSTLSQLPHMAHSETILPMGENSSDKQRFPKREEEN